MNDTNGLFQSLVAGASLAAQELRFQNAFLDSIYWDYKPVAQTPYTSLAVTIPTVDESDVADIGSGPLQPADVKHTPVTINFDKHFSSSFTIKDWDRARTPVDLKTKYIQPKLEGLARKVNRTIAQLISTTNFSSYTIVSGASDDKFDRADITAGWKYLANAGAPLEDDGNMFLTMSPTAYGNMLSDTNWIQAYAVSEAAAISAQQRAKMVTQYGCQLRYDQHIAKYNTAKEPGLLYHRYAIAGVTAPLLAIDDSTVRTSQFRLKNTLPVQMQMQYSLKDQGYVINLHCWWGVKVVRPELGVTIQTA